MTHKHATLGDTLYFWFASNDTSGSGGDGSTPLFDVRQGGTAAGAAPTLSGSPILLTDSNYPPGCHEVAIAATGGNGFSAGESYGVFSTLAIDAQNPVGFVGSFSLSPIVANVKEWDDVAVKLGLTSNLPQVDVDGWQGVPIASSANMIEDVGGPRWTAPALSQAPGSVGGTLSGHWRWSSGTAPADPGAGRVAANNAALGSITQVFINQVADDGFNFAGAIEDLGLGDTVTVARDSQGGNFFLATVQAEPVDNGDWYTIPVLVTDFGGSLSNNNAVNVSFHYQQASAAEIADAVWDEAVAAHTGAGSTGLALGNTDTNTSGLGGDAMRGTDLALLASSAPANFGDLAITAGTGQVTVGTNTDKSGYSVTSGTVDNVTNPVTVGTNNDKTGYNVTSGTVDTVSNPVTVGTNNDKTGYSLTAPIAVGRGDGLAQVHIFMLDTSGNPATGLTVTGQIVKDSGSFATLTNPIVEVGNGVYRVNGGYTGPETDATTFSTQFTATGAQTLTLNYVTQSA